MILDAGTTIIFNRNSVCINLKAVKWHLIIEPAKHVITSVKNDFFNLVNAEMVII